MSYKGTGAGNGRKLMFESQYCILDGHFSHLFIENLLCVFEKTKIKEKDACDGPFKKCLIERKKGSGRIIFKMT